MNISYVLLIVLIVFSVPLIICIMKAEKYANYVNAIDKNFFAGAKLFGLGFAIADILKINFATQSNHKLREQSGILFGRKYADFYVRTLYAQALTYCVIFIYASMFFGCLAGGNDGLLFLGLGIVTSVFIFFYYMRSFKSKLDKLHEIYMIDFPSAVSTIALLVNAGMVLRDAWKQVAYSSDKPLYMQMRIVTEDMKNGVSEPDAIFAFANRCATNEIRKFATTVIQAIERGGADLAAALTMQSQLLLNEKRQLTLQRGEKAANLLIGPIMMIFVGVLIMIMLPMMSNLGM